MNPIIVLGSSLAGYTLVRELRKLNRDIPITLVSRDNGDYYSKPMLSNAFAQNKDEASLVLTFAADMAKQLDIKLLTHTEVTVGWVATKLRDSLRDDPREKSSEQRDTHH